MFLQLKNLTKLFDKENGVKNFNLDVKEGEFITILGPSGCGKTTTLNLLGGFLKPDSGEILLDRGNITNLPPEKRPISTVFQSYALFPHMNVIENVAYGIRFYRKEKKRKAMEIAKEYIDIVGLAGYENSRVGNLSGGQQQRVALARSMATNPKILLLDEPLSNLDASLRVRMREELKELQRRFKITMIFVTHDQSEALCLSDKIVVMDKGNIVQVGTSREVYFYPVSEYVASFVGKSNLLNEDGKTYIIRPEDIKITKDINREYIVKDKIFMGQHTEYKITNDRHSLDVNLSGKESSDFQIGDLVGIEIEHRISI
ncbi:ABC transporter ATP-binding protein [Tissierella carlieri]|jgi:iron(III) transport system ATP-binding protein|uniref:ABC transporter ATP-binding protein n=1 Tax=Tissierella carlieri TaxID=689904 RepID=UPI001C0F8EB4|nr:ABC transporter ATP-binding protein [Tissierella carlieri]MBU5312335.1 ABC transporter ATP-binding protein [Tissierella carlieri]